MAKKFELFVDPTEEGKAQIGSKGGSIMFNGFVDREYCVLTNKRVYFKGNTDIMGVMGRNIKTEVVIDLASITSTCFGVIKYGLFVLIGMLFLIAGVVGFVAVENVPAVGIAGLVMGGLFILLYFLIRKRWLVITYSGGKLKMQCWGQPEANMRAFCNAIHAVADRQKVEQQGKRWEEMTAAAVEPAPEI